MEARKIYRFISLIVGALFSATISWGTETDQQSTANAVSPRDLVQDWQDQRFGMFVHWGVYSVPAGVHEGKPVRHLGEWIMRHAEIKKSDYAEYAKNLAPDGYDPSEWVGIATEAGMKYLVVTAKHHDGFALFDSKVTDWDSVDATPSGRDLLKPLVEECKKRKMPLGFHYSQAQDWWHPGGARFGPAWDQSQVGSFDDYLEKIVVPQISELISHYGPVANFFFDTPVKMNAERAEMIERVVPSSIRINDRLYKGAAGTHLSYETSLPAETDRQRPWELCLSINDTWGYKSTDQNWKSSDTLLRTLIDCASKGGNVLLNIGPDAQGRIPAPAGKVLREIGAWMSKNSESIHSTRRSPYVVIPWNGGCTMRELPSGDSELFVHLFGWPEDGKVFLPGLSNPVLSARQLSDGSEIEATRKGNSWILHKPDAVEDGIVVVKLKVKGCPLIQPPAVEPDSENKLRLWPSEAILSGLDLRLERLQDSPESYIGNWTDGQGSATWNIALPEEASFNCIFDIACDSQSAGSTIVILNANSEELGKLVIPSTGSWSKYCQVEVGSLRLPVGHSEIRIVPVEKKGSKVANLRSILLEPY